ncbi:hypothetical protein AB0B13_29385, partial [Streptomyces sp. NPDC042898]|uniref:hypothetical protein n=1 Tax=Streptomyces sp. NPDC042898 TaxID=3154334 RepID=UPI0033DBD262
MASRLHLRCRHALAVAAVATLTAVSPAATAPATPHGSYPPVTLTAALDQPQPAGERLVEC